MNEHSPTPWRACPIIGAMGIVHYCLCDAEDKVVGRTMDESVANRIVEAVNERDRLREERDAALAHADECERAAADERAKRARAVEEAQREANQRADRLRDLVRRLNLAVRDANEFATSMASMFPELGDRMAWLEMASILREARAELGEVAP